MIAVVTDPDQPGRVRSADAPSPQISAGHAIVRVLAASINRGELHLVSARPDGWAPGQDIAGVIEIAAPDGGPPAGTRVVGLADGGGWSELVSLPLARIAPLETDVAYDLAATLPVAGLTALRALRALGDILGSDLLVTGATGGVGHLAAQLAVVAGANVTGLGRRPVTLGGVRIIPELGRTDRFDRVVDAVGGDVLTDALKHLNADARVVTFGAIDGTSAAFNLATFGASPRVTIQPLFVYEAAGVFSDDLRRLVRFVATDQLKPIIARTFSFSEVNEALETVAHGIHGKIVLVR